MAVMADRAGGRVAVRQQMPLTLTSCPREGSANTAYSRVVGPRRAVIMLPLIRPIWPDLSLAPATNVTLRRRVRGEAFQPGRRALLCPAFVMSVLQDDLSRMR